MDLRQYLQALRKFWWAVAIPVVLCCAYGAFTIMKTDPVYKGSVSFFVRTTGDQSNNSQFAGDQFAQRRVNSYVALLGTDRMAQMIKDDIGTDLDPGAISRMISGTGDVNTVLLTATATSPSEELASQVTDSLSTQFIALVNEVENAGTDTATVNLELVSGPNVSTVPDNSSQKLVVFAFLGLMIGLAAALTLELADTAVRSEDQLVNLSAGPVLGRIPLDKGSEESPLIGDDERFGFRAEAFRQLRTNLQFINVDHQVQVIVITSSLPGEGKSVVSANLALSMAAAGQQVLAIEADLRRPMLAEYFDIERAVGLTDVLAGRAEVDEVIQPWGDTGLHVLAGGEIPPNPSELLGSESMAELLTRLREQFDMIIIDTPPLLPVTDAAVAATRADGALLVVRYGKTTRQQVSTSVEALRAVGATILGSTMTRTPVKSSKYSSYGYEPRTDGGSGSGSSRRQKRTGSSGRSGSSSGRGSSSGAGRSRSVSGQETKRETGRGAVQSTIRESPMTSAASFPPHPGAGRAAVDGHSELPTAMNADTVREVSAETERPTPPRRPNVREREKARSARSGGRR
ncbi:MAG: polysaccharide biosynthesis tyrosine autokinase [Microthrixaceae bacterium]